MFAVKLGPLSTFVAIACLTSCASPEFMRQREETLSTGRDFMVEQTRQLAAKLTEKDLSACRAAFQAGNGGFQHLWQNFELTGPLVPSVAFLCLKEAPEWTFNRAYVTNKIALVSPMRNPSALLPTASPQKTSPFWCILKYENGSFSVVESGIGFQTKRQRAEYCPFPNDPIQPSRG